MNLLLFVFWKTQILIKARTSVNNLSDVQLLEVNFFPPVSSQWELSQVFEKVYDLGLDIHKYESTRKALKFILWSAQ